MALATAFICWPLHGKVGKSNGKRLSFRLLEAYLDRFITSLVPTAEVVERIKDEITFQLPADLQDPVSLSSLFAALESGALLHHIDQWEILQTKYVLSNLPSTCSNV